MALIATVTFKDNNFQTDTFTYSDTASFATPIVGTGDAVSVSNILIAGLGATNYTLSGVVTANTTANITPAPLAVTVTGTESSGPPTFSVTALTQDSYFGLVNSEQASDVVNGTPSCIVVVPAMNGTAGKYPISCTGLSASNYNICYDYSTILPALVAATPAPLIVNVTGSVTAGTFNLTSYTFSGFIGTDTSSIVTGTLSCTTLTVDSSGGNPISCTGLSATGGYGYTVSYSYSYGGTAASATPLTVAVNGTVESVPSPSFTINSLTYSGFTNGDTISAVIGALSCTLNPTQVSGKYPISCVGLSASNYNIGYDFTNSPGTVAATPAPLTVNVTGSTGPTFALGSVTYSGFLGTDTPLSVFSGQTLKCQASATADAAGNYPISCSGLSATAKYNITYSYDYSHQLTTGDDHAPLTISVAGTVPTGGGGSPPLTITLVTYSGFINGDTVSAVTGALTCTTATGPNALTPYKIVSCSGLTAPGYYGAINYLFGKVTVVPAS